MLFMISYDILKKTNNTFVLNFLVIFLFKMKDKYRKKDFLTCPFNIIHNTYVNLVKCLKNRFIKTYYYIVLCGKNLLRNALLEIFLELKKTIFNRAILINMLICLGLF